MNKVKARSQASSLRHIWICSLTVTSRCLSLPRGPNGWRLLQQTKGRHKNASPRASDWGDVRHLSLLALSTAALLGCLASDVQGEATQHCLLSSASSCIHTPPWPSCEHDWSAGHHQGWAPSGAEWAAPRRKVIHSPPGLTLANAHTDKCWRNVTLLTSSWLRKRQQRLPSRHSDDKGPPFPGDNVWWQRKLTGTHSLPDCVTWEVCLSPSTAHQLSLPGPCLRVQPSAAIAWLTPF